MEKQYTLSQICRQFDKGWNAHFDGQPFVQNPPKPLSWREGWIESKWSKEQHGDLYTRLIEEA
jgi:hypothetical protein